MKARIYVTLKNGILDPQGKTIQQSLHHLGYTGVKDVRLGKYIEMELSSMPLEDAKRQVAEMCRKLLANTVIEDFRFDVEG
ncbi:MAG TPA: phosphoribosylformylglycinamidine synthase subunit PurS [Nitrospiria bacterium]|nr:phosphoribosylformylglycinamidine synthase subunit PurS [Nitrospiria bacterium]HUK55663.1 phosphoribosylformylglycinamidine synthase subunit PurS [Nitrospiria bacterium]